MEIPQSYTISKFFTYTNKAKQHSSYLNGGCPVCHEGLNWETKKRLYYYINDDFLYCYNCSLSWNPYWWIKEVSGMSHKEIKDDIKEYTGESDYVLQWDKKVSEEWVLPDLPGECVNLTDPLQVKYYKNNNVVQLAYQYCRDRRLFSAINSPKNLYVCLNDKYHKNRLIIPFYKNNRIICYTSRKLLNDDSAKYLLKFNSPKYIFNLDQVNTDIPYIFIFEGQIDAMFVKNGIAVSGLTLTDQQQQELNSFPFYEQIWVLDNLKFEKKEVINKIINKLKNNERLFLYENDFTEFKDLNEFCIAKKLDFIDPALIVNSSYIGDKGLLKI